MYTAARVLVVAATAALLLAAAGTAAAQTAADGHFVVELDTDGDADAVFVEELDLSDADQRELFESARADADRREAAAEQFREQLQLASNEASTGVARDIRVGPVTVELTVEDETGIVGYAFRWENLARVDDGRIVLSEPFSTFESLDRELVVHAPDGYELASVAPEPDRNDGTVAAWNGLTTFGDGFEVVAAPARSGTAPIDYAASPEGTYGGAPVALGVSALLLVSLLVARKR